MLRISKKRIIKVIAVVGLLVFLYALGALRPVESLVVKVLNPVSTKLQYLSAKMSVKYRQETSQIDLQKEVEKLKSQVNELIEKNAELKTAEQENEILREQLRFLTKNKYNYVVSNVISRGDMTDISNQSETIIIDKGSADGVLPGLAVVSGQGIIVGKVALTKDRISSVILINNSKCKLAAAVLGQGKTSGITEGEMGLTIKMNFIPQNQVVNPSDLIVTSGLEQSIPRGLVIGRVLEVGKENNDLWQNAVVEPLVDTENLIIVSVLLPF